MGDDHDGIIVLPAGVGAVGADAIELLGLRDEVLDIAVTPDRGYCFSMRGIAREAATAYGVAVPRPGAGRAAGRRRRRARGARRSTRPAPTASCCARSSGFDPAAPLADVDAAPAADVRHAPDLARRRRHQLRDARDSASRCTRSTARSSTVRSPCAARKRGRAARDARRRRARRCTTRTCSSPTSPARSRSPAPWAGDAPRSPARPPTSSSRPRTSTPVAIARQARRHKLSSEASRRFERGVDHELAAVRVRARRRAARRARRRRRSAAPPRSTSGPRRCRSHVPADRACAHRRHADRPRDRRRAPRGGRLRASPATTCSRSCRRRGAPTSPTRPTSTRRCCGSTATTTIPSVLPAAPAGRGLTREQRLRRRVGRALGRRRLRRGARATRSSARPSSTRSACPPTTRAGARCGWPTRSPTSSRCCARRCCRACSPRCAATSAAASATSRCSRPAWCSLVDRDAAADPAAAGRPSSRRRPSSPRSRPGCPSSRGTSPSSLAGDREPAGWWGAGRAGRAGPTRSRPRGSSPARVGAELDGPPGRRSRRGTRAGAPSCVVGGVVVGHAGELHPRVVAGARPAARAPARWSSTSTPLLAAADGRRRRRRARHVPGRDAGRRARRRRGGAAADVEAALREGAGDAARVGAAVRRLRRARRSARARSRWRTRCASARRDRTLTVEESTAARDAAVAEATARTGAVLARPDGRRPTRDAARDVVDGARGARRPRARRAARRGSSRPGPGEYGEGDVFIGVTVPQQRRVVQRVPRPRRWPRSRRCCASAIHEHRLTALLILVDQYRRGDDATRQAISRALPREPRPRQQLGPRRRERPDLVGRHTYADGLAPLLPLAASPDLWERRIAMVACLADVKRGRARPAAGRRRAAGRRPRTT